MKTLTQLTTEAALRLGDSSNTLWPLAELQRYAKDGYAKLCRESECLWAQAYVNDAVGVSDYALPNDFLKADRATWDNMRLIQYNERQLKQFDHQYRNEAVTGARPEGFFIDTLGSLRKYPVPVAAASNTSPSFPTTEQASNFRLEYYRLGANLSSNPFEIPDSWTRVVRHFILWKCYSKNGPGYSGKLAEHFRMRWELGLRALNTTRATMSSRTVVMGSMQAHPRGRRPPEPRLPWRFGKTVKGRR